MERLVEILGFRKDPMYDKILAPILDGVAIRDLDKIFEYKEKVIQGLFADSNAVVLDRPSLDSLVAQRYLEFVDDSYVTQKSFVVKGGLQPSLSQPQLLSIASKPVLFGKNVRLQRCTFDSQVYVSEGSFVENSLFPQTYGMSYIGPYTRISRAEISRCLISGNPNDTEIKTYIHPKTLLDTFVGYGAQISDPTVTFTHPLHDGNAIFVEPVTQATFDTGRRKNNPSFIGTQGEFCGEMLRTKIGPFVTLNNPCVVGSGYAVPAYTNFYGIAWLEEKEGLVEKHHIEPKYWSKI